MKKIIALMLALMLVLSFAACGNETENTENGEENVTGEENTALYEEIILNFGGIRRHDGSMVVSRKGSFYDFREGIEDCSALEPDTYYTWVASKTENSDKIKVALTDSEVYAYSADFFEGEVTSCFAVSAETLRESSFYYAEQNCYYSDAIVSSSEYVSISLVSAEENEDTLTLHLTLTDMSGEANYALTVNLLAEGGYNYVSYIAE